VASRTYSDTTAPVFYYYDSQTLPAGAPAFARGLSTGRLVAVCYGSATATVGSYTGYDSLGRANVSVQQTDGQNYSFSYGYNLAGMMTTETYPSLRQVTTAYDAAGRISAINGQKTGEANKTYASTFSYTAHDGVASMVLGNGKWEHTSFNSRLQPLQIGIGTSSIDSSTLQLDYGYGTTTNNGNVLSQTITVPGSPNVSMSQSYAYDGLNRLSSAAESGAWAQTYDFDRYGNRAVRAASYIPNASLTPQSAFAGDLSAFNANNNRIQLTGFGYDSAGNLTSDPTTAANAMVGDAENRQISYTKAGVATTYSYDGDGRRVKKIDSSGTTVFVYNSGGQLIAEYHSDPVPSPAGGGGTSYLTSDHLGSTRVVTKSDGSVKARYDYLPFGEELPSTVGGRSSIAGYSAADSTKQKFTQKERDNESGLDYFLARYYSSAQGRFASPDEVFADQWVSDPQSWNLYSYGRNNPLNNTDPNGRETVFYDKDGKKIATQGDKGVTVTETELIVNGTKYNLEDLNPVVEIHAPRYSLAASFVGGFLQGLNWPHVLFERALGVETHNTRVTDSAIQDHPIIGAVGAEVGAATLGGISGGLAARSLSGATTTLGVSRGPDRVIINHGHGGRDGRTAHIGTEAAIDAAIKADLRANPLTSTGRQAERTITVNGKPLTYRPNVRSDGTVRVGTYFDPTRGK
jgi:RHS repeat-associated protein